MSYEAANKNECVPARKQRARWLAVAVLTGVGLLVLGESITRYGLGLGDPPLWVADPEIEYLAKPGTYRRFGNLVQVNSRHMRADEFPERKATPDELRVMIMGDSVVNGGALTDQAELASQLLGPRLAETLGRPVTVGNISAGSWGPGNLLAYVRRFGLADADVVVVVLNSKDIGDNPAATPLSRSDPSLPFERPWSAIGEAVTRYLMPRIIRLLRPSAVEPPAASESQQSESAQSRSLADLAALRDAVFAESARLIVVHFPLRSEVEGSLLQEGLAIEEFAQQHSGQLVDLRGSLRTAISSGSDPYRPQDSIHPNELGQRLLANAVYEAIMTPPPGAPPNDLPARAP